MIGMELQICGWVPDSRWRVRDTDTFRADVDRNRKIVFHRSSIDWPVKLLTIRYFRSARHQNLDHSRIVAQPTDLRCRQLRRLRMDYDRPFERGKRADPLCERPIVVGTGD